ncbi:MAG: DUF4058 family protein [Verrucomicrobiae bacterium]|nr:DUF4058 family protein [Verrucomicrobiae bacterium]
MRPLEIRARDGRLVTTIEILSPANKRAGVGLETYVARRHWLVDHSRPLDPPLSPEDAAWANECLRLAGLGSGREPVDGNQGSGLSTRVPGPGQDAETHMRDAYAPHPGLPLAGRIRLEPGDPDSGRRGWLGGRDGLGGAVQEFQLPAGRQGLRSVRMLPDQLRQEVPHPGFAAAQAQFPGGFQRQPFGASPVGGFRRLAQPVQLLDRGSDLAQAFGEQPGEPLAGGQILGTLRQARLQPGRLAARVE